MVCFHISMGGIDSWHADETMTSVDAAAALGLQGRSRLKQQVGAVSLLCIVSHNGMFGWCVDRSM